jgi:hypothetical protein
MRDRLPALHRQATTRSAIEEANLGKIVDALVIAGRVAIRHEGGDLAFEIVVLKQDAVLERLMPALDLTWVCG